MYSKCIFKYNRYNDKLIKKFEWIFTTNQYTQNDIFYLR